MEKAKRSDQEETEREACAKAVDDICWSDVEELIGRHSYQPVADGERILKNIAAIIMALILYTLTLEKIHSIALLQLIGARKPVILGLILQQALLLGFGGYVIAYLLGQQLFPLFPRRVIVTGDDLWQLAGIVLAISVASSILGIAKALSVQPNEALG